MFARHVGHIYLFILSNDDGRNKWHLSTLFIAFLWSLTAELHPFIIIRSCNIIWSLHKVSDNQLNKKLMNKSEDDYM